MSAVIPGLERNMGQLLDAAEHHAAHLTIAIGEMLELAESSEDDEIDGQTTSEMLLSSLHSLLVIRSWKRGGA